MLSAQAVRKNRHITSLSTLQCNDPLPRLRGSQVTVPYPVLVASHLRLVTS